MPDFTEKLKDDLVEQFKEKPVIEALVEAIGEQMNDVYAFFMALNEERWLQTAVGKQLDGIGDLVVLSRKEAGELACLNESVYVLDDDGYRDYLIYKVWKNSCNCTYKDIIKAFRMFWDKPLYYKEDPDYPATMFFETGELSPTDNVQKLLNAPFVKAAGVGIKIMAITVNDEMFDDLPVSGLMGRGYQSTILPEIPLDITYSETVHTIGSAQNITQTSLPEMEETT